MTTTARRRSAYAIAAALAVVLAIIAAWLLRPDAKDPVAKPQDPPAPQVVTFGDVLKPLRCGAPPTKPFVPTRITVPGVTTNAQVLAMPRDSANVPQAPPLSSAGKSQFAWDKPTTKPGSAHGNVLINAHTWPDGSALGNHLLDKLKVGGWIMLYGNQGQELCYRVTKRDVIVADHGSWEYYGRKDGPPQVALIVCSPPRLGPGIWKHRTIWYASPEGTPEAGATAS